MVKRYLFVILLLSELNAVTGQDHCVDAEFFNVYNQYPKIINGISYEWNGDAWNVPVMKQVKVSSLDIGGNGMFKGLLEYTPASYSEPANSSKEYPVIIFFHGFASRGEGTTNQLCRILKDGGSDLATHKSLPGRVERTPEIFVETVGGETLEYLLITPQFTKYVRPVDESLPHDFPSADEVENVIDYVVDNYRIDERRIYLTGLSNGANMVMEYAASSLARAQRVAAIMPVSLCSPTTSLRNLERGYVPENVAAAGLPVWFVQCNIDVPCGTTAPESWYDAITAIPGHIPPRYTLLNNSNPNPLYQCSDSLLHDAWSRAYDPNFRASFNDGSGANDGINLNMYEWFSQQLSAVLPVKLQNYLARLVNGRVELKWETTDEKGNESFSIERAGADQKFVVIGTVPGMIDYSGVKKYLFVDEAPLADLSYYRLVQNDVNGEKTYFEIKKIVNRANSQTGVIISPNPFMSEVSAFVTIDRSQKVIVTLTDLNGKALKTINRQYSAGTTEIKLNSQDLPKGIYLLKVSGETFNSLKKVIKR